MTRYSEETIHKMHEHGKMLDKKLHPLHHEFKDKTIEEIQEKLGIKNFLQEEQTTNK